MTKVRGISRKNSQLSLKLPLYLPGDQLRLGMKTASDMDGFSSSQKRCGIVVILSVLVIVLVCVLFQLLPYSESGNDLASLVMEPEGAEPSSTTDEDSEEPDGQTMDYEDDDDNGADDDYMEVDKENPDENNVTAPNDLDITNETDVSFAEIQEQVNCPALFVGNQEELERTRDIMNNMFLHMEPLTEGWFLQETSNCTEYLNTRGYTFSVTEEEINFPIAFSILIHKDIERFERLLRLVYRPSNYYCIHVDAKSPTKYHQAVKAIGRCLPNVVIMASPVQVYYGEISLVQAELICMSSLYSNKTWRYYINLSGKGLPLKTNLQQVQALKVLNGRNNIDAAGKDVIPDWVNRRWLSLHTTLPGRKESPPYGALPVRGSTHVAVTREFVGFVLYSQVAKDMYEWVKDVRYPAEHYFQTLNHNQQLAAPGGFKGDIYEGSSHFYFTRLKVRDVEGAVCDGVWLRRVCVFGLRDLPMLARSPYLFADRFDPYMQPVTYQCMEEYLRHVTLGRPPFDTSYYVRIMYEMQVTELTMRGKELRQEPPEPSLQQASV